MGEIRTIGCCGNNAYIATFARYLEGKGYLGEKGVQVVKAEKPAVKKEPKAKKTETPKVASIENVQAETATAGEFGDLLNEWLDTLGDNRRDADTMLAWRKGFFVKWLMGKRDATKKQALGRATNESFASLVDYLCEKGYLRAGKVA